MSRLFKFRWGVAVVLLCALMQFVVVGKAQGNSPTFQAPLALIGNDGNVWIIQSGSTQPTPLTQNADFKIPQTTPATHTYTHLRWSPDGKTLAFQDSAAH